MLLQCLLCLRHAFSRYVVLLLTSEYHLDEYAVQLSFIVFVGSGLTADAIPA